MFSAKSLQVVVVALWLLVSNFHFEAYGDAVVGDPKCDPPCQQYSPPSSGYPSYGAPTPPTPQSGYSIYGTPPPPHEKSQSKCPPAAGVQCCTPPAPYIYGPPNPYYAYGPPNPYNTYGPPNPYAPPNGYTYVPYGQGESSASVILPFLVLMSMLVFSFVLF